MTDSLTFASATPRFALPFLHAGQAQKEVFVNEAFALTDMLMHCAVQGEASAPPANPQEGDVWLVGLDPSAEWKGHTSTIAAWQSGAWRFITPRNGLRLTDLSTGGQALFLNSWRKASTPVEPLGGTIVDGEARAVITELIAALQALGILPSA